MTIVVVVVGGGVGRPVRCCNSSIDFRRHRIHCHFCFVSVSARPSRIFEFLFWSWVVVRDILLAAVAAPHNILLLLDAVGAVVAVADTESDCWRGGDCFRPFRRHRRSRGC